MRTIRMEFRGKNGLSLAQDTSNKQTPFNIQVYKPQLMKYIFSPWAWYLHVHVYNVLPRIDS